MSEVKELDPESEDEKKDAQDLEGDKTIRQVYLPPAELQKI